MGSREDDDHWNDKYADEVECYWCYRVLLLDDDDNPFCGYCDEECDE